MNTTPFVADPRRVKRFKHTVRMIVDKNVHRTQFCLAYVKEHWNLICTSQVGFVRSDNAAVRLNILNNSLRRLLLHSTIQNITTDALLPATLQLLFRISARAAIEANKNLRSLRSKGFRGSSANTVISPRDKHGLICKSRVDHVTIHWLLATR